MSLMAQAVKARATEFASPYAVIEAFAAHHLSEDDMVDLLAGWQFAPVEARRDPAGVTSDARPATPGSAEEIAKAYARRLINRRVYSRIRESIHERQGG